MFCQHCGNEVRQGLNYCNRCGGRVYAELAKVVSKGDELAQTLSYAAGFIGFAGIVALAILIGNLLRRGEIPPPAVLLIIIFCATVLGVVFSLVRQVSKLHLKFTPEVQPSLAKGDSTPLLENKTSELDYINASVSSVTEHTTRLFEPATVKKD